MQSLREIRAWVEANRDLCVEALRIYLGVGLIAKGFNFLSDPTMISDFMRLVEIPFFEFLSAHFIGMAHICGGILLTIGLLSRIAALSQIPILLGAVFFVHWPNGLFSVELQFTLLVLFILVIFSIYGGGRLSVDYALLRRGGASDDLD